MSIRRKGPIFEVYGIEMEVAKLLQRKIWLNPGALRP